MNIKMDASSGCKEIGIRKFEVVAKKLLWCKLLIFITLDIYSSNKIGSLKYEKFPTSGSRDYVALRQNQRLLKHGKKTGKQKKH